MEGLVVGKMLVSNGKLLFPVEGVYKLLKGEHAGEATEICYSLLPQDSMDTEETWLRCVCKVAEMWPEFCRDFWSWRKDGRGEVLTRLVDTYGARLMYQARKEATGNDDL
jgi:hypothetical protein